jgi:hypothetical protein
MAERRPLVVIAGVVQELPAGDTTAGATGGGGGGSGDVVGPAASVDGNIAVFDGTTGKLLKDSGSAPTSLGLTVAMARGLAWF